MDKRVRVFRRLTALVILAFVSPVRADSRLGSLAEIERLQDTLAAVAARVRPSVVAVRAERQIVAVEPHPDAPRVPDDEVHRSLSERIIPAVGTGVVISRDGLILTNEHVIHNADPEDIEIVLSNGDAFTVQEITSDPRSDLAVLRIDARDLKPIRFGDVSRVKQGHFVMVMGNPFGTASDNRGKPAMTFGVVGALGRVLTEQLDPSRMRYYGNLIQTDARINPGNSGGPLLNIRGEAIGLTTAISTRSGGSDGVGYAITLDERIREIIDRLAQGREVEYGFLGVDLERPTAADRKSAGGPARGGAVIRKVDPGTPASKANLRKGDIVVAFGGTDVQSVDHLVRLVGAARVGVKVDVKVYRDHKPMWLSVAPSRREILAGINIFKWRGMKLTNATPEVRDVHKLSATVEGVVITYVEADGGAGKAGFEPGQVIHQIGDVRIKNVRQLREITPQLEGILRVLVGEDPDVELTLP